MRLMNMKLVISKQFTIEINSICVYTHTHMRACTRACTHTHTHTEKELMGLDMNTENPILPLQNAEWWQCNRPCLPTRRASWTVNALSETPNDPSQNPRRAIKGRLVLPSCGWSGHSLTCSGTAVRPTAPSSSPPYERKMLWYHQHTPPAQHHPPSDISTPVFLLSSK